MINSKNCRNTVPIIFMVQLVSLLIMGIVEFLNMTQGCFPRVNTPLLTNAGIVLSILSLWTITLWKAPRDLLRRNVILGVVMVLWFLIVEGNRRINHDLPLQSLTTFAAVYLIALPFASMTQDQDRQAGIRLVSGFYFAAAMLFLAFGLILMSGIALPNALVGKVYWDGPRLFVVHHPNITSRIFLIGIALSMGFFGQAKQLWAKILMTLASCLLFVAIALGNCRAVVLPVCCILAGNVFFLICRKNRKLMLLGVVAAALTACVLFMSSNWLYQWNSTRLYSQPAMQTAQEQTLIAEESPSEVVASDQQIIVPEETPLGASPEWKPEGNGNSGQGTLLDDLPTLNGRFRIWTAFFQKILDDPAILLRGTIDSRLVFTNLHTHNAWLEALIMLGLPGFLLVLVFTFQAAWTSLRLIFHNSVGLFQKNIALLTLATMVGALLEPCLFITYLEWSFSDFFFFLCLGYQTLWSKQISYKR